MGPGALPPPDRDPVCPAEGLAADRHRHHRCADLFLAAIVIAATVIFWLRM